MFEIWFESSECLESARRLSGGRLDCACRVSGGYLWDVQMVCGCLDVSIRQARTGQGRSTQGQV